MAIKTKEKSKSSKSKTKDEDKKTKKSKTVNKEKDNKPKKKRYSVFEEEYKGTPVIAIHEVDKEGEKLGSFPVVSMGMRKWEIVLKKIKDIKELVEGSEDD